MLEYSSSAQNKRTFMFYWSVTFSVPIKTDTIFCYDHLLCLIRKSLVCWWARSFRPTSMTRRTPRRPVSWCLCKCLGCFPHEITVVIGSSRECEFPWTRELESVNKSQWTFPPVIHPHFLSLNLENGAWVLRAGVWGRETPLNACPSSLSAVTGGLIFPPADRCCLMTAGQQFACSTDNKRPCACQNRWRCVTVPTQCCLLLAWPSDLSACLPHNQEGDGEEITAAPFLWINLIPMPLSLFLSALHQQLPPTPVSHRSLAFLLGL